MRILWLHLYFATPQGWGSTRTWEFGRRFAAAGHSVDVLCSPAYDPTLAGARVHAVAGMRVRVSRTRYRPQMGFFARLAAFLGFAASAAWHVLRHGRAYDLILASSGPLTMALPALLARRLHGTPFVFEVIDVWPDSAIAAGVLRNRLLQALAFRLEARAYRRAARIVTCSPAMTARVTGKGVPAEKVVTISNSSDLDAFRPDPARRAALRAEFGVREDQTVVLYTGAMGRSNAIDDLVETARLTADDPRLVWWFAGDGAEAAKLRALPGRFFGQVPRDRVADLCRAADVAVVTFLHAPLFHENSPNKFFDAIAAGLPVLFNRSTWLAPELAQYGCGFVCEDAHPAAAMAARLRELAGNPDLRARMGLAARRLAEERYARDRLATQYLKCLECAAPAAL
jgi:glycosyltransferase involved in cell wall biosynthesis